MQDSSSKTKKQMPIAVYVRQRPQNKQETEDRSPSVIEIPSSCKTITVKHLTCQKEYKFDEVFGPECTQIHVYYRVLEPLIEEVLQGYNCTVFAYGQTGTGKTYTIIGDLENSEIPAENNHAGLISRAAAEIFQDLNKTSVTEYTVRVSFVELYNEELKDLLRDDNDAMLLKLYEDPRQKGSVIIQNLSERTVCSAEEVYELLMKGMEKRQTAATLLNDHSSRSHCVFTINVYVKEMLVEGVVTVRTGKLNLVDLAGSENISRSGAVNTRAREAGNINQSLLTLGRVIKALVEHQQHIPYRESKLTRILQDSLGGRTKTAIIATISPSLHCLEETLSTLDYANRACLIVNCPEVNKDSSKNQIVDMLTKKIESAQKDIAALRTGAGFYVDADNYQDLLTEKEKTENLVLSKNEFLLRLEEHIKEITKTREIEQKRWEEVMESFTFTKLKYEEYKQKSLKTKAQARMLHNLVHLKSEQAKKTVVKNLEMNSSIANFTNGINRLSNTLNQYYHKSSERAEINKTLNKVIPETANKIDNIIQTRGNEIEATKAKVRASLRNLISIVDNVIEKNKKQDSDSSKIDLKVKDEQIEAMFAYEKSNCINYCNRTRSTISEAQEFSRDFWEDMTKTAEKTVSKFQSEVKKEKRKIEVYVDVCESVDKVKNEQLQRATNPDVYIFSEKNKESLHHLQDLLSDRLAISMKKQKLIEEIKKDLEKFEKETHKQYSMYKGILKKTENTAKIVDTVMQGAIETSEKASKRLETVNPSTQLENVTSYVHQSGAEIQNIATKYLQNINEIQSRFDARFLPLCTKVNTEVSEAAEQYKTSIDQTSSLAKDSLKTLNVLINNSNRNQTEKITSMASNVQELEQLSENLNYHTLAKKVHEELSSLDKENVCIKEFKQKWTEVKPSGNTPKKQESNYKKNLVYFDTPVAARAIRDDDDSLLDISVGSVNISIAAPETVENLEELLEEVDISVNESVFVAESEAESFSMHASDISDTTNPT